MINPRAICAYYISQKFRFRARINANRLLLAKTTERCRAGCIFIISRYHSAYIAGAAETYEYICTEGGMTVYVCVR